MYRTRTNRHCCCYYSLHHSFCFFFPFLFPLKSVLHSESLYDVRERLPGNVCVWGGGGKRENKTPQVHVRTYIIAHYMNACINSDPMANGKQKTDTRRDSTRDKQRGGRRINARRPVVYPGPRRGHASRRVDAVPETSKGSRQRHRAVYPRGGRVTERGIGLDL